MDTRFTCNKCNQHIAAPEDMAGENVSCPNCNAPLTVPQLSTLSSQPISLKQPEQTPTRRCSSCGHQIVSENGMCSFCAETTIPKPTRLEDQLGFTNAERNTAIGICDFVLVAFMCVLPIGGGILLVALTQWSTVQIILCTFVVGGITTVLGLLLWRWYHYTRSPPAPILIIARQLVRRQRGINRMGLGVLTIMVLSIVGGIIWGLYNLHLGAVADGYGGLAGKSALYTVGGVLFLIELFFKLILFLFPLLLVMAVIKFLFKK